MTEATSMDSKAISGMLSLSYQKTDTKLWQNWHPAIVKLLPNCRQATGCFLDVLASHDLTQMAFDVLINLIQTQRKVFSIGGFKTFISFIFTGDKMPMRAFTSNPTNRHVRSGRRSKFCNKFKTSRSPQLPPRSPRRLEMGERVSLVFFLAE